MNVIVVGAGVVGTALAEQFSQEGHRVSVVDADRRKVRELEEKLDVLAFHGNAGSLRVLEAVGVRRADMCVAVTNVDEVNLVVGMLASRLGVRHSIVRMRNPDYAEDNSVLSPKELGIARIINPEPAIVAALMHMIEIPGSSDIARLADGQVLMLGFTIHGDSPAAGKTLAELGALGALSGFLILYIVRGEEVIVPRGGDTIEPGDSIYVLVVTDMLSLIVPVIHRHPPVVKSVIISGASRVGLQVAEALEKKHVRVFLIEPHGEMAEEAAARLKRATVLCGEPTDLNVLDEAAIDRCDLFCAVSDDDQSNMLAALLAKKHGAKKHAVVVDRPEYVPVLNSLGMEIVINPRLVTVGEILTYVRRGNIHSVKRLAESRAEIIEMEAPAGCQAVKAPLRDLKFPRNALVGAVMRDGMMHVPTGDTHIRPGETVVIYTMPDALPRVEKLFAAAR